jgi:hypothetical protein
LLASTPRTEEGLCTGKTVSPCEAVDVEADFGVGVGLAWLVVVFAAGVGCNRPPMIAVRYVSIEKTIHRISTIMNRTIDGFFNKFGRFTFAVLFFVFMYLKS